MVTVLCKSILGADSVDSLVSSRSKRQLKKTFSLLSKQHCSNSSVSFFFYNRGHVNHAFRQLRFTTFW